MMTSHVLRTVQQKRVDFDPTNADHLEAFSMLCIGEADKRGSYGVKQHPTLRFNVEEGFEDVRSMMLHKVGKQYLKVMKKD